MIRLITLKPTGVMIDASRLISITATYTGYSIMTFSTPEKADFHRDLAAFAPDKGSGQRTDKNDNYCNYDNP